MTREHTIWLIEYLIGYIIAYYLIKYTTHSKSERRTWEGVSVCAISAITSWVAVIVALTIILLNKLQSIKIKKDPPKWL